MRPWWDSLLGKILSRGVPLPLDAALNFADPLEAKFNQAEQRIDVGIPNIGFQGGNSGPLVDYFIPFFFAERTQQNVSSGNEAEVSFRLTPNREHTVTILVQIQGASYYGKELRRCSVLTDGDSVVAMSDLSEPIFTYTGDIGVVESALSLEEIGSAEWIVTGGTDGGLPTIEVSLTNTTGAPVNFSAVASIETYLRPGVPA